MRPDDALLSVMQVAHLLNVSRLTIYRLIERGALPVYRIARRLRFSRRDLQDYLANSRTYNDYGDTQT
jgi:putative molybdopterin biosynthesis protein